MDQPLTPALVLLSIYFWIWLVGGLTALVLDLRADAREASMKLRPWNASWLDFALYAWSLIMLVFAAQVVASYLLHAFNVPDDDLSTIVLAQGLAFHGVALVLIVVAYRRAGLAQTLTPSPERLAVRTIFKQIVRFFFAGVFLAMLLGKGWEQLLVLLAEAGFMKPPAPQELVELFTEGGLNWRTAALIFLAVVIAPISEEFVFRAGLYRFLKGRFSARTALVVSSLLFAMMHFNTLSFLPLLLIGMLLCRAYERSGNILVPIGFHALFNANTIALLVLAGPQVAP